MLICIDMTPIIIVIVIVAAVIIIIVIVCVVIAKCGVIEVQFRR